MDKAESYRMVDRVCANLDIQRPGQAAMNVLGYTSPKLYAQVSGTELDPFYDSSRLPALMVWLDKKKKKK